MTDATEHESEAVIRAPGIDHLGFLTRLIQIVELACGALRGCSKAALFVFEAGGVTDRVATDDAATRLANLEHELCAGPGYDALGTKSAISIPSLSAETRWPELCRAGLAEGIASVLALPLVVDGAAVGALTLFSEEARGFDERDQQSAAAVAEHATVTLESTRSLWQVEGQRRHLEEALETRGVIEQAKGILIAREHCSPDEAFAILRRASQRSNRRVSDLASELVERAQRPTIGEPA